MLSAACSPTVSGSDIDAGGGHPGGADAQPGGACSGCAAPNVCSATLGCVACDPGHTGLTCQGSDLYVCNADGTLGAKSMTCPNGCALGTCNDNNNASCTEQGSTLIYLVDDSDNMYSFDPGHNNAFARIGRLNCPAGAPYPAEDDGSGIAHPFSMSVDRTAQAWVLYSSGEIFQVNTTDATCKRSSYAKGGMGFQLFGMGFVSDTAGGDTEKLFIAGGSSTQIMNTTSGLGYIDPTTLAVSKVGTLQMGEYSPELTGTGAGELYAYYPGSNMNFVGHVNKATAAIDQQWSLPGLDGQVVAWAFAQWGGKFYVFVTIDKSTNPFSPDLHNYVYTVDPSHAGNMGVLLLSDTAYTVVGAGVSTCAPTQIG